MRADFVIVGAGSAGCVLAERLSRNPAVQVLLLEAGPKDKNPLIRIPKGFGKLLGDDRFTWHYPVRPIGPNAKVEHWVRGRTLGGSSSVNGMIYNRGSAADYDDMAAIGGPQWSWGQMLPVFKAIENHHLGASETRGVGGPLDVSVAQDLPPIVEAMIDAGSAVGLRRIEDLNADDSERIGPAARTISGGKRVSASYAFLRAAAGRPNLTVVTDATAECVLFEGDKATGVRFRHKDQVLDAKADREVLLSLGSIATPKLLQLSGIGEASHLRSLGIDVVVDSPNVGQRMREHRCFSLQFRLKENVGYNRLLSTPARQAVTGVRYLATRKGPLATGAYDAVGFLKTDPALDRPDAQLLMAPFSAKPFIAGEEVGLEKEPGMQCIGYILRPDSEGSVTITGTGQDAPLDIDPRFFESPHDRAIGLALFRAMREMFGSQPIAAQLRNETVPGVAVQDDQAIIDAGLDLGYCGYHAIGTAAMGPESTDVVDGELRVRGVSNLRVIDCSVMRTMVSGNLNGPMMAMAWRSADLIEQAL
jgi:choline dehydrogenase